VSVKHIPVGTPEEIQRDIAKEVWVGDRSFLVTRYNGKYLAFSNVCPHQMFELWPSDIDGAVVHCMGHNYSFDIRTGECVYPFKGPFLHTLPVEERDGQVCIRLEGEAKENALS
jgi:nitrite reductase/ring-hydroxylating ferredoxin subunit